MRIRKSVQIDPPQAEIKRQFIGHPLPRLNTHLDDVRRHRPNHRGEPPGLNGSHGFANGRDRPHRYTLRGQARRRFHRHGRLTGLNHSMAEWAANSEVRPTIVATDSPTRNAWKASCDAAVLLIRR